MASEDAGLFGLNGKTGEVLRWAIAMALAGVIGVFGARLEINDRIAAARAETADKIALVTQELARVESKADAAVLIGGQQFDEIQRSLTDIKAELVRLRSGR